MLSELIVEGLGVIERADLVLGPGSNVLTGETGAGKTLVVAAVDLLLGGRAGRILVREGSAEASVEGRFVVAGSHPAVGLLTGHGVIGRQDALEDVEIVVVRTVPADGRPATARVNGRLVTAGLLSEMGATLVEIAGQHEHQRIGTAASQRATLDAFAGPAAMALSQEMAASWRAANAAERMVEELTATERSRRRELDVLRYEIAEIESAALQPGETMLLSGEASRLEHAELIAEGLRSAIETLQADGGAHDLLSSAYWNVANLVPKDPELSSLAERLEAAGHEVDDVAAELAQRVGSPDPEALEQVRERLAVLGKLRRKYGEDEAQVLAYLDDARSKAEELERAAADVARLEAERDEHRRRAQEVAGRLSSIRREAAARLEVAMSERLGELALANARFEVEVRESPLYEGGAESVTFKVAANSGETPKPITRVASGGELSRITLALRLLTASAGGGTFIFDEVDAGTGGAAAQAVGRALAQLARSTGSQVIVVTHLPQVAAFAETHFRVTKSDAASRARAEIERVEERKRVAELSRMLAGLPASERAQEHAQELLDLAARTGAPA